MLIFTPFYLFLWLGFLATYRSKASVLINVKVYQGLETCVSILSYLLKYLLKFLAVKHCRNISILYKILQFIGTEFLIERYCNTYSSGYSKI